ncbi:C-C motif chemokine 25 [Pipistrellus kuhlii]|uniref:C-C motif chemokine 25 n=1 Tax=Pipistrellus kuhlii TaxID=59472 RepID=A0A7J7U9T3_PIPKU|nr:C-C motif chemokine 25 [Pipistrellus kuhlii]KAF6309526.1 C-C motif chemokine ligand 25 [Pipistrellus kuhlii]
MNLWLLACLVTCFIDTWTPAVQAQGVFEDCCLRHHHHIRKDMLKRAHSYRLQEVSGSCNIQAVIFYFPRRDKKVCGDPEAKWVQNWIKFLDHRKMHHQGTSGKPQGSHPIGKKLRFGTYRVQHSIRSNERNASLPTRANPGP